MKTPKEKEELLASMSHDIERLKSCEQVQERHKYVGFIYEEPARLLDYLPRNGLLIMDEMSRIQDTATSLDHEEAEWYSSLLMTNRMVKGGSFSFDWTTVWDKIDHQRLYMSIFLRHIPNTQPENIIDLSSRDMQEYHEQVISLKMEVVRGSKNHYKDM